MEWRAWFTENRRYTSEGAAPQELPEDGMLGVVKYLHKTTPGGRPHRQILSGDDHYFYWRGEWFSNSDSVEEIEARYPGVEVIVRGKWATTQEMDSVQAEMREAKDPPSWR